MFKVLRYEFPGIKGWALCVLTYAVLLLAILLCLGAPEAPFAYGEL